MYVDTTYPYFNHL